MLKIARLSILLSLILSLTSCSSEFYENQDNNAKIQKNRDALEVALEANLKYREVNVSCGWFNSDLTAKVIMIPLNKEVIRATVAYKSAIEKLTPDQESQLLERSYKHFINAESATFIMMVINNQKLEYGKNTIYFDNFRENVVLISETQGTYKLRNYDTNLSTSLSPGLNMGYVSFNNLRGTQDGFTDTYTIHFKNFKFTCSNQERYEQPWALLFDESEVNFVDLIAKGTSKQEIRNQFVAEPYESVGLKAQDVTNLLVFVIKILK